MFDSYGLYNYFYQNKNSKITQKLTNNNNPPQLEDLLIEEDIVDELQNKNEKLINYLNKEKIKQMLDYIIKEQNDEDHNKAYKFPFVVSKLFNVEDTNIMKYFFKTDKEIINEKLENDKKFEDNKNEINNTYFDLYKNEENKENIKDKEINIDDINVISNEDEDNNEDNCNYNYDEIKKENNDNDDEVNIKESNDSNKNIDDDIVNQDNEEENKKENKEKEEEKSNNLNEEDVKKAEQNQEINKNEKEEEENNNICIFKSSHISTNNNISKNQRYEHEIKENKNEINHKKIEKDNNYPEDKIEILDYFLSFLMDDSELNYVLCGYFSSLMTNLLNIDCIKIIKYLFLERKDILKRLVYHSYRKSIAETLCKIIKYEDKFNQQSTEQKEEYDEKEYSLIRLDIIKDIFKKIDINMYSENLYSISYIINDLSENKKILEEIVNDKNIIQHLINKQLNNLNLNSNENTQNLLYNKKNNLIIIIDIIINWLNSIKKNDIQIPMVFYEVEEELDREGDLVQQTENNDTPEIHHTILSQALFDVLPDLIKNNYNQNKNNEDIDNNCFIIQSFNDSRIKPFGLHKIKIVEIITCLIPYCKNIPNEYDNLLINSCFFENSINYIFEYEWNNFYQEAIFQFLKKLLIYEKDYPYHEISLNHLFTNINILKEIMTHLTNIKNRANNEGNTGNGSTSLLISLSYLINTIIGGISVDLNKSYTKEGSITFMDRGNNINNKIMEMVYNMDNKNTIKNEDKNEDIKPMECMKKYCNEEWNTFFKDYISNIIKVYEEKLYDNKNTNISFSDSKDDLFAHNNENDKNDNNNEEEDLLSGYKSRDEELFEDHTNYKEIDKDNEDDFVNNDYDIKKENKKDIDMAKFKDMEININDFNFVDDNEYKKDIDINDNNKDDINKVNNQNIESSKENEEKSEIHDSYNSVNYWKSSLEKENNSYLNNIGEEAMNDLLD